MKNKILVLTSTFPHYPTDTKPAFVYELSKRLTNSFNTFVLAPWILGSKRNELWSELKIKRFQYWFPTQNIITREAILPAIKSNKLYLFQIPFFLIFQFINLVKICKKEKIRLIHAHWIIPQGLMAILYKKIFNDKVKILITAHGADVYGLQSSFMMILKKVVIKNAETVTAVSESIKHKILEIHSRANVFVVPMGTSPNLFHPKHKNNLIKKKYQINGSFILYVGRLAEKKGVKHLIIAMNTILIDFPKTKLLIIGSGKEEKKLKILTKRLNITDSVKFLGAIQYNNLNKFYSTADIFVCPSIETSSGDTEGLGLTLIEAGFSGCLLVGSNVGGIVDIIKNNKTGLLVKQGKSEDIVNKIKLLLSDSNLRNRLKIHTRRELVKRYSWNKVIIKYKDLIEKLL